MWMNVVQMSFFEEDTYVAAAAVYERGLDLLLLVMRARGKASCGLFQDGDGANLVCVFT